MGGIGAEEPASVGAEHLDGDLGCRGSHGEDLPVHGVDIGRQVLDDALRNEEEGEREGQGQEDVEDAAREVHPGVPEPRGAAAHDAADQRHEDGEARGG